MIIDVESVYEPCEFNDRLLLGLKGSMAEFELGFCDSEPARLRAEGTPRTAMRAVQSQVLELVVDLVRHLGKSKATLLISCPIQSTNNWPVFLSMLS